MAKLNLDIHIFKNNSIILEGNSPITNSHMEILNDFEVIYLGCAFNQSLEGLHNGIKAIRFYLNDEFYIRWNSRLYKNMDYNRFSFTQPINNLHDGLEYLELHGPGHSCQEFNNLPKTLKYLFIYWRMHSLNKMGLELLPSGLEILYIDYSLVSTDVLAHLPSGLKGLYLNGPVEGTIHNLPKGLETLYINGVVTQLDKFINIPDSLITFIFDDCKTARENKYIIKWLFKNKKMPKSLKTCILPIFYVDIYRELQEWSKEFTEHNMDLQFYDMSTCIEQYMKPIKQMYE